MRNGRLILMLVGTMALATAPGAVAQTPATTQPVPSPRAAFLERVEAYVALHRRLEVGLPAEVVTSNLEALFAPGYALARQIRIARATARQGDIFTPTVTAYLRSVIADSLRRGGIDDFLTIIEDENEVTVVPTVNGDYPAGASISFMPPCLLAALPPLPRELEYRFLGRDLVLWDLHAGLIVDFVPRALPEMSVPGCR